MAVGPTIEVQYQPIAGLCLGTAQAGIKQQDRKDLVVIQAQAGTTMAGVFTANAFCAAPVHLCRRHLAADQPLALVVNTGNANAGTGAAGDADALATCAALAQELGLETSQVLPFSTGVIGEKLPIEKIIKHLPQAVRSLDMNGWQDAAWGILTTDTCPKGASVQIQHQGQTINLSGISKGSGMIRPNMATMLAFVATDATCSQGLIQQLLTQSVNHSFNRITVDGDMSTNDSCILMATGASELSLDDDAELKEKFTAALVKLMQQLAHAIVRDGEGATKFISVEVAGGANDEECLQVAYAIAHSPLTKTAMFASDPNWGRILAAVGYSGVPDLDVSTLTIHLGDTLLVEQGGRAQSYTEAAGQRVMDEDEITIAVDLKRGTAKEIVWTTDLSYNYVKINADYRS
ncbi:MAG: bifunctional glutamate N-acetyltransferase/amino-acid acetyltransferase ArgJ [Oceanospirillaceae bacterium]|jgi:glutamate N-acetyltransferase/amino-acid N-acetyltransferase|nr:bifunctional glutamate N-acetyltransferase/amino-acid acetyltransferase ArgJ [Oceanospirillaceae bacterium]MBT4443269.1 bifunctional glutamate N-acetyltransferase/amino-acid acetyltransferase ArgJ [Oceanospirillaceae bacterium]MBT6078360.1 bifunctional glutamate N-acetyltransferase/amino-acid acetyltransferase ArgJ [Oceanospirillaceae bacterium]MBT7331518.1 bifunctional glutamate N-acetyltransferase/amino-acid acetyltransferase ArgJ [Oceanospirillaceae bacterium]